MYQNTNEPRWSRSSFCGGSGAGTCVEVAVVDGGIAVRDGKDPSRPALRFTAEEWIAFLAGARAGEFDL
ncbi:MAG TPA: DUF397 domain-containing protein [Actinocrinis sp.]|nr:DUF397 domain-containing protein [Actinocrinis sp.]